MLTPRKGYRGTRSLAHWSERNLRPAPARERPARNRPLVAQISAPRGRQAGGRYHEAGKGPRRQRQAQIMSLPMNVPTRHAQRGLSPCSNGTLSPRQTPCRHFTSPSEWSPASANGIMSSMSDCRSRQPARSNQRAMLCRPTKASRFTSRWSARPSMENTIAQMVQPRLVLRPVLTCPAIGTNPRLGNRGGLALRLGAQGEGPGDNFLPAIKERGYL